MVDAGEYYDRLRERAWKEAETRYHKCYNDNHERIRPFAEFDHEGFLHWGRLWALLVMDVDDPGCPDVNDQLREIMNADMDMVLSFMYG